MFRQKPQQLNTLLGIVLRNQGLETPLLQRRLITSWDDVVKETIHDTDMAAYILDSTETKEIRNQTLWIHLNSPAARQELQMHGTELANKLNNKVGARLITGIRFQ